MTEFRGGFSADGHELSAAGGFTTEVCVKRNMAAGEDENASDTGRNESKRAWI